VLLRYGRQHESTDIITILANNNSTITYLKTAPIATMKKKLRLFILVAAAALLHGLAFTQTQNATVKINKNLSFQKVTGFGGFVNSPQFGYNHMTEAEIRKMWGANSEAGYNIMRIYIPTGTNNWAQVIPTAQLAKSLGIKIFASPWSMPTEWKTDPIIGSVFTDEFGVKRNVYLKEEHYTNYANYLNSFVVLLRNNGVELDAISIQNEPDYQVDYAGCIFTPAQMTKFLKENRHLISCKVIAPETVGIPDNYANAFNAADVLPHFDIFGGHQYGAIQNGFKNLQANGKEAWMTEFLINWNSNGANRSFNWAIDAFDFANSVNDAMLANINAWIHYATKRYYGMMGDGTFGTPTSEISKRGRILSHFAKYVVGGTRIESTWNDNSGILKGSSYQSVTGDSVLVVVINPSANTYNLALDLPFLSVAGKAIKTTETENMTESPISLAAETNRPKVMVSPSSITTLIFEKSGSLTPSLMTGAVVNYAILDSVTVTNMAFGNAYKLSGKTTTFNVNAPLISANQNAGNGYLPLASKFNRLVFRVESLSSAGTFISANTTLHYINAAGAESSYNYGTVTFNQRSNFDWVIDISENVLTDGCTGVIGLTNGNYVSILTFKLNNVFFAVGTERGYKFVGPYSNTDGNLLDCLDDITYTSLDLKNVTGIPTTADWDGTATNKNSVYYVTDNSVAGKNNVVVGESCEKLELRDLSGNFYPQYSFTATSAKYTATINGYKMLVLPFTANLPVGVTAYNIEFSDAIIKGKPVTNGIITANIPVLVKANGTFIFEGSGTIAPVPNLQVGITYGIYIGVKIPQGAYYLTINNNEPSFTRATSSAQPMIDAFDAYVTLGTATTAASLQVFLEEPLPVTFSDFTLQSNVNHIQLKWNSFSELNNKGFYIERSTDGIVFEQIGFVNVRANTSVADQYSFTDKNPIAGINYYRIKQADIDGAYSYSQVKSAQFVNSPSISLYPNPVISLLTIDGNGRLLNGVIILYDAVGRIVLQSKLAGANMMRLDLSKLPAGLYYYRLNKSTGTFTKL
jgi:glucuronoarabinoxylan endo-1,4-beta-xylanase